jgi:Putative 2OG-Fe(II) oxygenase
MIYKTPLFEVPMYKFKASRHAEIKQWMMTNVLPEFEKNGPNETSRNLYSSYFPGAPKLDHTTFSEFYAKDISNFLTKAEFSKLHAWKTKVNFWYNLSLQGSYQEVHDHLGGPVPISYAAIHYVMFDKTQHVSTVFYNPLEAVLKSLQPTTKDQFKPADYRGFQKILDVEEGDIIIVPSYVPHSVMKQVSTKLRITVAFNISVFEASAYE